MKQNSQEYRQWKKRQNDKNLKLRSKIRHGSKGHNSYKKTYLKDRKKVSSYNKNNGIMKFITPKNFSFLNNPKETISFFDSLLKYVSNSNGKVRNIFVDSSNVTSLTTDALMYLLAVVNNLNEQVNNLRISGNIPKDPNSQNYFIESGFNHFVNYRGSKPLVRNKNKLQIVTGTKCDTQTAKNVIDFVCSKSGLSKTYYQFLYIMMIELMSNTQKHAYNNKDLFNPCWYCFVNFENNIFSFTFLDIGEGIPSTVKKTFSEKIIKVLGIDDLQEENKYVISALNGKFRTATGLEYRGKGLPKIKEICSTNKIQNLRIISNKSDVSVDTSNCTGNDLKIPLRGTVYYWQVDIENLKGDKV